jgi:hypothetical protein
VYSLNAYDGRSFKPATQRAGHRIIPPRRFAADIRMAAKNGGGGQRRGAERAGACPPPPCALAHS